MSAADTPASAAAPAQRFPLLDGVRAIAALSIVGVHISDATGFTDREILGALGARLNVGVAIFFVLSGFLLYRPFAAARLASLPQPSVGRYLRRRALRILPAYWVALLCMGLLGWISFPGGVWRYVLFLQNWSTSTVLYGIPAAWTLDVEVAFYLTLPLLSALAGWSAWGRSAGPFQREWIMIGAVFITGVACRTAFAIYDGGSFLMTQFPGFLAWFAGGMGLAILSLQMERSDIGGRGVLRILHHHPWLAWIGALICYLTVCFALSLPRFFERVASPWENMAQHLLFLGVAVFVTLPAVLAGTRRPVAGRGGVVQLVLGNRVIVWLGLISYGIFLWHQPFLGVLLYDHDLLGRAPFAPMLVVTAATVTGAVLLGAASYYIVERPFLRLKDRRTAAEHPTAG